MAFDFEIWNFSRVVNLNGQRRDHDFRDRKREVIFGVKKSHSFNLKSNH